MKEEIRKKLKIKRRYFAGVRREEADKAIAEEFLLAFGGYESLFIYNAKGDEAGTVRPQVPPSAEAGTRLITEGLAAAGKKIFAPRVEGKNLAVVPFGECSVGAFGVEEPLGAAADIVPQVTVVPLLAVNPRGYRIGYGGGYYDRFLADKPTLKVGLGYGFQTEEFQEDVWDVPLDIFICERGIYRFERE